MPRFRTENGELAVSIGTLLDLTRAEADWYFVSGMDYKIDGLRYCCTRYIDPERGWRIRFVSPDTGECIDLSPEMMGIFLPDVAIDGQLIERYW